MWLNTNEKPTSVHGMAFFIGCSSLHTDRQFDASVREIDVCILFHLLILSIKQDFLLSPQRKYRYFCIECMIKSNDSDSVVHHNFNTRTGIMACTFSRMMHIENFIFTYILHVCFDVCMSWEVIRIYDLNNTQILRLKIPVALCSSSIEWRSFNLLHYNDNESLMRIVLDEISKA